MKSIASGLTDCGPSEIVPQFKSKDYLAINWKVQEDSAEVNQFFVKIDLDPLDQSTKIMDKTLTVTNIPLYLSQNNLRSLFETFGEIDRIVAEKNSKNVRDYLLYEKQRIRESSVAHIVFKDSKSLEEIKELKSTEIKPLVLPTQNINAGMHTWMKFYSSRIKNEKILEAYTKEFMQKFERKELKQKALSGSSEPDDEGWVSVTRKGKRSRSGAVRTEKMETKLLSKKAKWEKRLLNFTPTQIKESRAKQLEELKKKFDEDKQRIALLRQQRKFKPF